jgi:hypothetical protein
MKPLFVGRLAELVMPLSFALAIIFCLVRVGQTATHEYFYEKPLLKWTKSDASKPPSPTVTWNAADVNAKWEVRYRPVQDSGWRVAYARLVKRIDSEFLTKRLVYAATLSGLLPGRQYEYAVYRNQTKVYSERVP